ncbi:hypothetical protein LCGC14_0404630 [marine sediment metagenome]|uniref:Uncharacterized protein n=1 Tax=marine sediment metagenome TaxID=412755 RepID=A0A0F9W4Q0_9ZZZZ|nr:MAG: hypothetical protein Lokiarch_26590 [Candidatus Lokiarchaeum sp. GC14_75]
MISDILIIKDGLPLISANLTNSKNIFSQEDNLLMISGFFSALNSFSDSFEELGSISELKLSKNDLKLSFLKEPTIPSLIYLASFDGKTETISVMRFLSKVSRAFLQKYDTNQISGWNGKKGFFKPFEKEIRQLIEEEDSMNEKLYNNQVSDWLKSFDVGIEEQIKSVAETEVLNNKPKYFDYVPIFTSSEVIDPKLYLTGEISCQVFEKIDGEKNIAQITKELDLNQNKVYNICKNLIKMGFIAFD